MVCSASALKLSIRTHLYLKVIDGLTEYDYLFFGHSRANYISGKYLYTDSMLPELQDGWDGLYVSKVQSSGAVFRISLVDPET